MGQVGQAQMAPCKDRNGDRDGDGMGAEHGRVGHQPANESGCCRGGAQANQSDPAAPWVWCNPQPGAGQSKGRAETLLELLPKNLERCSQNPTSVLKARNPKP